MLIQIVEMIVKQWCQLSALKKKTNRNSSWFNKCTSQCLRALRWSFQLLTCTKQIASAMVANKAVNLDNNSRIRTNSSSANAFQATKNQSKVQSRSSASASSLSVELQELSNRLVTSSHRLIDAPLWRNISQLWLGHSLPRD